MKKFTFCIAVASILLTAACSQEEVNVVADEGIATVTFTAELPSTISTKAYSDGLTATNLSYAVYENGDTTPIITSEDEVTFEGLTATVSLDLVTNVTYDIIFWADSPNSPYTFNASAVTDGAAAQTVTVDYDSAECNDEDRDAFYAATTIEVKGSSSNTITLYRPFAQINFGTSDLDAESISDYVDAGLQSKVTVSSAYQTLNLLSGEVSDEVEDAVFALADIPDSDEETFPVDGYDYLAMNYILVSEDQTLVDCTLEVYSDDTLMNTISVSNAPVQRNYQTNIYGSLLTSTTTFTITIDPAFTGTNEVNVWDGTVSEPSTSEDDIIYINDGSELAWVSEQVAAQKTLSGKTVILNANIDLNNLAWTPIGNVKDYPSITFAGTFDGNGYTISNLNATDETTNYSAAGLFGSTKGTIKNLTVKNATITSHHYAGVIVGYSSNQIEISNCTVDGATVTSSAELIGSSYDNGDKVGGIIGYAGGASSAITSCTVTNTTITAYRDLGGIVGYLGGSSSKVSSCTVDETVIITVDNSHDYKSYGTDTSKYDAGSIVGELSSAASSEDNTGDATINYPESE